MSPSGGVSCTSRIKNSRLGFLLLEVLLYLACTVLLAGLFFPILRNVYTHGLSHMHQLDTYFSAVLHADFIARDIQQATTLAHLKKRESHTIIMPIGYQDVSWFVKNGKLTRITGHYSLDTGRWSKMINSVVGSGYARIAFTFDNGNSSEQAVDFRLILTSGLSISGYSVPRVGMLF